MISRSPGDLEPVFVSMLEKAVRICDATFETFTAGTASLEPRCRPQYAAGLCEGTTFAASPNPNKYFGRMLSTNAVVHIPDVLAQLSKGGNREYDTAVELGGVRTRLAVPMLKGHELIGSISLFRQQIGLQRTSLPKLSLPSRTRDC